MKRTEGNEPDSAGKGMPPRAAQEGRHIRLLLVLAGLVAVFLIGVMIFLPR